MEPLLSYIPVLSHILVGFFFAFAGVWNIYNWQSIIDVLLQKKIPLPPLFLGFGILLQITCGILIILGIYVKLAALLLIPFTLIAVNTFHPFWKLEGELRTLNFTIYLTQMTSTLAVLLLLLNHIEANTSLQQLLQR